MSQTQSHFDVIISGGGMVGMSMAVALARDGVQVAVIEKGALTAQLEPNFDGRVSAIAQGSKRILDNIGVWEAMAPHAEPIKDIRVSDGDTPFFLHYDHHEVGEDPFGFIVENRYIRHALHAAAEKYPNLVMMDKRELESFVVENEYAVVTLKPSPLEGEGWVGGIPKEHISSERIPHLNPPPQGGRKLSARLLIAADGKQSPLRDMAGIKALQWDYAQTAIVCTIAHDKPHKGLAQERFLPAGPFAVLPMQSIFLPPLRGEVRRGGEAGSVEQVPPPTQPSPSRGEGFLHRSSLVWVEPADRIGLYMELPDDEFVQEIKERVGDYLGDLKVVGGRFTYPLSLMHAKNYTADRVALIGDAAHGMHPIAGQGVNVGFRDVAVLHELIMERFSVGLDIADAATLSHYERWRRFDNVAMLAATDWLNRLFSNKIIPIQLARGLGLWAVGKMPPVKRFFMRHAMGLVGDLPRLNTKK